MDQACGEEMTGFRITLGLLCLLWIGIGLGLFLGYQFREKPQRVYYFDHGWDEACAAMEKEGCTSKFCYKEWLRHTGSEPAEKP